MARYSKKQSPTSDHTHEEALDLTRQALKPSDLKEHRKVVAQGIQKGIDLYKKQYKAKVRELDKQLKKTATSQAAIEEVVVEKVRFKQSWIPWSLLAASWLGFIVFYVFTFSN